MREFYRGSVWEHDELRSRVDGPWAQVNITESKRGAIRGLHGEAMNKLVGIVSGQALGAYLDAREGSPTYGAVHTVPLEKGTQVFVPKGVCNGFQSVSDETQYLYCFDTEWRPGMPGVAYNPLSPDLRHRVAGPGGRRRPGAGLGQGPQRHRVRDQGLTDRQ